MYGVWHLNVKVDRLVDTLTFTRDLSYIASIASWTVELWPLGWLILLVTDCQPCIQ